MKHGVYDFINASLQKESAVMIQRQQIEEHAAPPPEFDEYDFRFETIWKFRNNSVVEHDDIPSFDTSNYQKNINTYYKNGTPPFNNIDNPGGWSDFIYRPYHKNGKIYQYHKLPTGITPVPGEGPVRKFQDYNVHY